jgi:hypothetical protein
MIKHKLNKDVILDGTIYRSIAGIVKLPKRIEKYNPIDEQDLEAVKQDIDNNESLRQLALDKKLASPSHIKRWSETKLKEELKEWI